MKTLTYFIQRGDDGPIKIGITTNLARRLRALATGSAEELHVLGCVAGDHEAELHQILAAHRLQGEWFSPAPEVLEAVPSTIPMRTTAGPQPPPSRRRRGTGTIERMPDGAYRPRLPGAGGRLRPCASYEEAVRLLNAKLALSARRRKGAS